MDSRLEAGISNVVAVGPFVRVVHGLLIHVSLYGSRVATEFAGGDDYSVASASHPSRG